MENVTIQGKNFQPYISEEQIHGRVKELAQQLNEAYQGKDPIFLPILNGAFMFTADLVRELNFLPEIQFVKVSSYGDNMSSSRQVKSSYGLNKIKVKGRHILIIEDIIDSGFTCGYLKEYIEKQEPASVSIISLMYKPQAFEGNYKADYVGFEIPNDFIIGYGMDFAQQGRSLRKIYQLVGD
jgi:hypoxanthine phosphoribosyltransferase